MKTPNLILTALLLALSLQATGQNLRKLSPYLADMTAANANTQPTVCALVKLADGGSAACVATRYGCTVIDSIGHIYIVDIPVARLSALSLDERVRRIEAHPAPLTAMDTTSIITGADKAHTGQALPQAFTGKGVITGVSDTGFDFGHPAFHDADGQLRIRYYYDFNTQKEYTDPASIKALRRSTNATSAYHGTHTASIMAGSEGKYSGVAYDGELCIAEFNCNNVDMHTTDGTTATAILAFKRLFDYAEAQGKPCVINFSVAGNPMWSDPYELESEALRELCGPGRIVVAANGNFGHVRYHVEKPEGQPSAGTLVKGFLSSEGSVKFDLRCQGDQTLTVSLPNAARDGLLGGLTFSTADVDASDEQSIYQAENINGTNFRVTVTHFPDYDSELGRVYRVKVVTGSFFGVTCTAKVEGDGRAELLADRPFSTFNSMPDLEGYNDARRGYSVSWPADQPFCIGVGATGHRFNYVNLDGDLITEDEETCENGIGGLASFSGRGPALDHSIKPDVCAPGVCIKAAFDSYSKEATNYRYRMVDEAEFEGKTYHWLALRGTSMATPVVAGTVALWLQAKPDLTADELRDVFAHTARQPDATLAYPNTLYGYGEIDTYRGLLYLLGLSGISDISQHQPSGVRFVLTGRHLAVEYVAMALQHTEPRLAVYDTSGRLVLATTGTSADLSALPAGVYAVQLTTDKAETTGSTLIRL